MHRPSSVHENMDNQDATTIRAKYPTGRITRSQAKALGKPGGVFPSSKPCFKQDQKRASRSNSKRAASDENKGSVIAPAGLQHKRRAVLKDVTNICENPYLNCINPTKIQTGKQTRRTTVKKNAKGTSCISMDIPVAQEDAKTKLAEELSKIRMEESHEITLPKNMENKALRESTYDSISECSIPEPMLLVQDSIQPDGLHRLQKKEDIADIDSNLEDPQVCSLYAHEIYDKYRVTELERRPSAKYMENLQHDITPNMRGILIDWLVEVSEEYKLVPDTLYLTVNIIDSFLSKNYIEKQRLQLLGVTSMLIASKYEEICAPRVEEFCFITDNTYTREEVLKMESQILNFLHFRLSVPTTKTFLRRFIQAAQASYKVPCIELELLANYLAELTLTEYSFHKFLPSLIAASVVFLAKWTLNSSEHPWNPTLEHYTDYKALELKSTVIALQDLQLNSNGCTLTSVREKYKQVKFKSVATLTSSELVLSLFNEQQ